ncbi:hypothetical protein M2134_002384 [Parabacteroides sp. PM6-13]|nr:hypothetical protein [Parabacteroides sp. PM6-13]
MVDKYNNNPCNYSAHLTCFVFIYVRQDCIISPIFSLKNDLKSGYMLINDKMRLKIRIFLTIKK